MLKETSPGVYKLLINGKQSGKRIKSGIELDAEENTIQLNDKLFDIPCSALPDNVTFRFYLNPDDSKEWLHITSITRKKNKLIVSYFTTLIQGVDYYLNLNPYVLIMKIAAIAEKAGMKVDEVNEESANTVLFLIENTTGTLRQKIIKGRTIIDKARNKVEQELVNTLKKGSFVSKLNANKYKDYLDFPW